MAPLLVVIIRYAGMRNPILFNSFYAYISQREFNISMWRSNNILKRNWRKVKQGLIRM